MIVSLSAYNRDDSSNFHGHMSSRKAGNWEKMGRRGEIGVRGDLKGAEQGDLSGIAAWGNLWTKLGGLGF